MRVRQRVLDWSEAGREGRRKVRQRALDWSEEAGREGWAKANLATPRVPCNALENMKGGSASVLEGFAQQSHEPHDQWLAICGIHSDLKTLPP